MSFFQMSAAITAGGAAMVRQYYMDGFYPSGQPTLSDGFVPSAALLKATLIHSTVPDTVETPPNAAAGYSAFQELDPRAPTPIPYQTGPTPKSGFGRVQLDTVLKLRPSQDLMHAALELFVVD